LENDLLEALYKSQNPRDIIRFYTCVGTDAEVLAFSKSRPRADIRIVAGESKRGDEVIAVIPTINSESEPAKEVGKRFSSISTIFVESRGKYFNYASSVNTGINSALQRNPDWIIISNDDVIEIDPIARFANELALDHDSDLVMASVGASGFRHHSLESMVYRNDWSLTTAALDALSWKSNFIPVTRILKRFDVRLRVENLPPTKSRLPFVDSAIRRSVDISAAVGHFCNFGDFGAFRAGLFKMHRFDELFINGCEDRELSIRLKHAHVTMRKSTFRIGSTVGKTLGSGLQRNLRDLLNQILLDRKIRKYFRT
jgi:hypothetical protein